jgi:hypothetical protein
MAIEAGGILTALLTTGKMARDWLIRPKLEIALRPPPSGQTIASEQAVKFRHMEVSNPRRQRATAHNVRVYLIGVKNTTLNRVMVEGEPIRMWWAYERNDVGSGASRTIGAPERCDLVSFRKPERCVRVEVIAVAWNFNPLLPAGHEYRFTFMARSDEVDSASFSVDVKWDGEWSDDEGTFYQRHAVVRMSPGQLARR